MSFNKLKKKLENGIALQPLWNEEDCLSIDEKTKVYAVMRPMLLSQSTLKDAYEILCDEYRRRLCQMWDFPFEESWWMADKIGSGLFLADFWNPINMEELRYIVENNVTEEAWLEYCAFLESEINADRKPRINFFSWMKGLRPEMLKE